MPAPDRVPPIVCVGVDVAALETVTLDLAIASDCPRELGEDFTRKLQATKAALEAVATEAESIAKEVRR